MKVIQQQKTRVLTHEGHTENRERGSENRERERGWREGNTRVLTHEGHTATEDQGTHT